MAVIIGSQIVGHSLKTSLIQSQYQRLGKVNYVLNGGERFFSEKLLTKLGEKNEAIMSGIIALKGLVKNQRSGQSSSRINIYGIDDQFLKMSLNPKKLNKTYYINRALVDRLSIKDKDPLLVKWIKQGSMNSESIMSTAETEIQSIEMDHYDVLGDDSLGNFNLEAHQVHPYNIFVPLSKLQEVLNKPDKINLILCSSETTLKTLEKMLKQSVTLEDLEIKLTHLNNQWYDLKSNRVFMSSIWMEYLSSYTGKSYPLFSYLTTEIEYQENHSPYPLVVGLNELNSMNKNSFIIGDDEIMINEWLSEDLSCRVGDQIKLKYYVMGDKQQLIATSKSFKVKEILKMDHNSLDREMMPDFPGIRQSEHCRDWDVGFKIDQSRIRDKDEQYWKQYKGIPKAVISFDIAQTIWKNRYGDLTGCRFESESYEPLKKGLLDWIDPKRFGLFFVDIVSLSKSSVNGSMDFSGLFMGFSFFILIAAFVLILLLFKLFIDKQKEQILTLHRIGFSIKALSQNSSRIFMILLVPGLVLGVILGQGYSLFLMSKLNIQWRDAIGNWDIFMSTNAWVLAKGSLISILIVSLSLFFNKHFVIQTLNDEMIQHKNNRFLKGLSTLVIVATLGMGIKLFYQFKHASNIDFFTFGFLSLFLSYLLMYQWLSKSSVSISTMSRNRFIYAMLCRNRWRSLSVMMMISCASFMLLSLEVFKLNPVKNTHIKSSGSGGYQLILETTQSINYNLAQNTSQRSLGLNSQLLDKSGFLPLRFLEGEDASCINLNRAQKPHLLGVDAKSWALEDRFEFSDSLTINQKTQWSLLKTPLQEGELAVIGDQNSILYSLGNKVGGTLNLHDEFNRPLKLLIVGSLKNSIFQDSLICDESELLKYFPSIQGFRRFLIECPDAEQLKIKNELSEGLNNFGIEVVGTNDKLMSFFKVQNTYIDIFQTLGMIGLFLGVMGMSLVLMNNIQSRRDEFRLLYHFGMKYVTIRKNLWLEHSGILGIGLVIGGVCGMLATMPMWLTQHEINLASIGFGAMIVFVFGLSSVTIGLSFSKIEE